MLVRRAARGEPELRSALDGLEDGYGAVVAATADIAEAGFDATSAVQAVVIHYLEAKQTTPLFGINVPWWATFLIISMLAALVARPFLRVHF